MRKFILIFLCSFFVDLNAQVAHFNQFPSMLGNQESLIEFPDLDTNKLSFAFSMRKLFVDYEGPLIRLRRDSDGALKSFYPSVEGLLDLDLINIWRESANVYVQKWFNQGGFAGDAGQSNDSRQPQFFPDAEVPYLAGDGVDDSLIVSGGGMQQVTNKGKEGTLLGYFYTTSESQFSFGVRTNDGRWSSHLNWNNGRAYFDGGTCCSEPRSFVNPNNTWGQYTFIRLNSQVVLRKDNVLKTSGNVPVTDRFTKNHNFGICFSNGSSEYATTRFTELILFKIEMESTFYKPLELNMMSYWGI